MARTLVPRGLKGRRRRCTPRNAPPELTDGAGLATLRRLWDALGVGAWIDERASGIAGYFPPSLMVELWVALLWYGGGWLSDVGLLDEPEPGPSLATGTRRPYWSTTACFA